MACNNFLACDVHVSFHKQQSLEFYHNLSSFFSSLFCFSRLGQQLSLTFLCVLLFFYMSLASGYLFFSSVVFHFFPPLLFCPGAPLFSTQFTCCSSSHAHQPLIQILSFDSHLFVLVLFLLRDGR